MKVPFKKLHPDAVPPSYATPGDAGMDLTPVSLEAFFNDAGEQLLRYRFGLAFEIPEGYVGLIFPRSSICMKTSLMLTNSVGVIDSGYRGGGHCGVPGCVRMQHYGGRSYIPCWQGVSL